MAQSVGSKVKITAEDGTYIGIIDSVDLKSGRITLSNDLSNGGVTCADTDSEMNGKFHFHRSEIEQIEILDVEEAQNKKKTSKRGDSRVPTLATGRRVPKHISRLRDIDRNKILLSATEQQDDTSKLHPTQSIPPSPQGEPHVAKDVPANKPSLEDLAPSSYTILNQFDAVFDEAIGHILNQRTVGLVAEGSKLGRDGKLCWVAISTSSHILLFDIVSLGSEAFTRGLSMVLQESNIFKIIHDCRLVSDLFHHQYHIKLVNVFDTQVADAICYKRTNNGRFPRYVSSLSASLFQHLDLPTDDVYVRRMREGLQTKDESVWWQRPPPPSTVQALVKSVRYLRELRRALLERMLQDFTDGVDVYLSVVRDADTAQRELHMLPEEFGTLNREAAYSRGPAAFKDNCMNQYDPHIKYCHDGLWRAGDGTVKKGGNRSPGAQRRSVTPTKQQEVAPPNNGRSQSRPSNEATTPSSGRAQTRPSNEATSIISGRSQTRPSNEATPPNSGRSQTRPSNEATPTSTGRSQTRPSNEATPTSSGRSQTRPSNEAAPPSSGRSQTRPSNEATPPSSGQSQTRPSNEATPPSGGRSQTRPSNEATSPSSGRGQTRPSNEAHSGWSQTRPSNEATPPRQNEPCNMSASKNLTLASLLKLKSSQDSDFSAHSQLSPTLADVTASRPSASHADVTFKAAGNEHHVAVPKEKLRRQDQMLGRDTTQDHVSGRDSSYGSGSDTDVQRSASSSDHQTGASQTSPGGCGRGKMLEMLLGRVARSQPEPSAEGQFSDALDDVLPVQPALELSPNSLSGRARPQSRGAKARKPGMGRAAALACYNDLTD